MSNKLNPNATSFIPINHQPINHFLPLTPYHYSSPSYIYGFQALPPPPPSDPVEALDHRSLQTVITPVAAADHDDHHHEVYNNNNSKRNQPRVSRRKVVVPVVQSSSSAHNNVVSGPRNNSCTQVITRRRKNGSFSLGHRRWGVVSKRNQCYTSGYSHADDDDDGHEKIMINNFTTLMIRNIPNRYTREMLLEFLDNYCTVENQSAIAAGEDGHESKAAIDFLYLPIDFRTELNKGYAFVNFANPRAAIKFWDTTNNKRWDSFQSRKIRQIAQARVQGKEALVAHFEKMGFPCENEEFLPVCFSPPRDGSKELVCTRKTIGERTGIRRSSVTTRQCRRTKLNR